MSNISLDTEGERMMWGGIIGSSSIAFVTVLLVARRIYKKFLRDKEVKQIVWNLYSGSGNGTPPAAGRDGEGSANAAGLSPPCDSAL